MSSGEGIFYPAFDPKQTYKGTVRTYRDNVRGDRAKADRLLCEEVEFYTGRHPNNHFGRIHTHTRLPGEASVNDPLGDLGYTVWEYRP